MYPPKSGEPRNSTNELKLEWHSDSMALGQYGIVTVWHCVSCLFRLPTEVAVVAHLLHALAHLLNAVQDVKMRSENNENNVKMRFNVKMSMSTPIGWGRNSLSFDAKRLCLYAFMY